MREGASARVRIGAVPYLNAKPLVLGIERGLGGDRIRLEYDVPSALADRLAAGGLDLALIPAVELARIPGLEVVPGLAITSRGPAGSVLLASRVSPGEIRRLALDPHSRTSNALARILLAEVWRARPDCEVGPTDLDAALERADAAVRIGDKALFEPIPEGLTVEDLGKAWNDWTGLPFVFAVWAAREGVLDEDLTEILHASSREGLRALDSIADGHGFEGQLHPRRARTYLRDCIRYRLGPEEGNGLEAFFRMAERHGLIERAPALRLATTATDDLAEALRRAP